MLNSASLGGRAPKVCNGCKAEKQLRSLLLRHTPAALVTLATTLVAAVEARALGVRNGWKAVIRGLSTFPLRR